jgi:hypothetical protein
MPPMYGWLVKEQRGRLLSTSVSSVEPWLNALSYIPLNLDRYAIPCPPKVGMFPTSGYYLNNMEFLTEFHRKKLKWKETEKIETRKEV